MDTARTRAGWVRLHDDAVTLGHISDLVEGRDITPCLCEPR